MLALRAAEIARDAMIKRYNCCEAVLLAANEIWHLDLAPDTLATGALFREGMGSGCSCGALVGLMMVSGILSRRYSHPLGQKLGAFLHGRFKEEFGSSCCRVIRQKRPLRERLGRKGCLDLTARTAALMVEIWEEVTSNAGRN